jgi:hypothetical protein
VEAINEVTGAESENESEAEVENEIEIESENEADIENEAWLKANTGDNEIEENTGPATAETGDAEACVEIENDFNAAGIMVDIDPVGGMVSVGNSNTGHESENEAEAEVKNEVEIESENEV